MSDDLSVNHPPTTQRSYDQVADEYSRRMLHELDHKPFDRQVLDRLAAETAGQGLVIDLGCGPGQVAYYLHKQGASVIGIDLSPRMVELAQRLHPQIIFQQGDMATLPFLDNAVAGIAAFYSILHIPRDTVVIVLRELARILQPNGVLLLSFHLGSEVRHLDEWWNRPVALDFVFFQAEEMRGYLQQAGFTAIECIERDPYPEVEVQTRRAYVFARKPVK